MKFLLIMHMNPALWDSLSEDVRNEVMEGHGAFMETTKASGEFVSTQALADPGNSSVVRVRDGVPVVADGPYTATEAYLAGYYLVDCEDRDRAVELAALIPDAGIDGLGIEVRPVMFHAGMEM